MLLTKPPFERFLKNADSSSSCDRKTGCPIQEIIAESLRKAGRTVMALLNGEFGSLDRLVRGDGDGLLCFGRRERDIFSGKPFLRCTRKGESKKDERKKRRIKEAPHLSQYTGDPLDAQEISSDF